MFGKIVLNSLIGLVLIFVWSRFVDLNQILEILQTVNPLYLLTFVVFVVISNLLRSIRLKILLNLKQAKLKDLVMINFLSQFLSFMIPIRAGEITKSVYLSTQYKIPIGKSVVWVLIDRFFDFWADLALIVGLLSVVSIPIPKNVSSWALLGLVIFSAVALFLIKTKGLALKLIDFLSRFFIKSSIKRSFVSFSTSILEGLDVLRVSPVKLLGLLLLTVVTFVSDGAVWYFIFLSLGITNFGLIDDVFGNALLALTFLLPAAPGFVGSAEAAGLAVWSGVMGLESNLASAATVLFHILTIVVIMIFGVSSLYFLKFDLTTVWQKIRKSD